MLRILHCHSTFALGGKEARAVQLMNAFGDAATHVLLSAVPGALAARDAIDANISVRFPEDAPLLAGRPGIARYRTIAQYMQRFDLVLTYNWGAMDAVMARRMFPGGPPVVHHEDGFNADETVRLKTERTIMRRLALPAAAAIVVPSTTLEAIARDTWKQPPGRVHRIANGIATAPYGVPPRANAIPQLRRRKGEVVIGTLAGLRPVKNLQRLVRAALSIPATRLVIVGEGPERDALVARADELGASDRLLLTGFLPDPHRYLGLFDVFALSSDSEQFPIALVEAMAAGLPIVSTDVGDVRAILPPDQQRFVVARDQIAVAAALRQLVADGALRKRLGENNQLAAKAFDADTMVAAYAALYDSVLPATLRALTQSVRRQ